MPLLKVKSKGQVTLPDGLRKQAGVSVGDVLEATVHGRKITLIPKLDEEDEYTPAQRRIIDAQLEKAERGPFHGPFKTANEMIAHLKGELKKRATLKKTRRSG